MMDMYQPLVCRVAAVADPGDNEVVVHHRNS